MWTGTSTPTRWLYGCAAASSYAKVFLCQCAGAATGHALERLPGWDEMNVVQQNLVSSHISDLVTSTCNSDSPDLPPGFLEEPPDWTGQIPNGTVSAVMGIANTIAQCFVNLPAAALGAGLECLVEHASQISIYHGVIEGGPGHQPPNPGSQYVQCTRMSDAPVCSNSSAGMPCQKGDGSAGTCGTGFGGCACR